MFFQYVSEEVLKSRDENLITAISNYRDFTFQIWPKLISELHRDYSKLLKKHDKLKDFLEVSKLMSTETQKELHMLHQVNIELDKVRKKLGEEGTSNDKIFEQAYGKEVKYGAEVQFMHLDSRSFLNVKSTCSQIDKTAYQLELSTMLGSGMVFKIQPKFKLRAEGDNIQFRDQILVMSVKQKCYLDSITKCPLDIDEQIGTEEEMKSVYGPVPHFRRLQSICQRFEAFVSQNKDMSWQIWPHNTSRRDSLNKYIYGGDIVKIIHTDVSGLPGDLTVPVSPEKGHFDCFLRVYWGKYELEKTEVASLWEVEYERNYSRGDRIEFKKVQSKVSQYRFFSQDEEIKGQMKPTRFKLRNLFTGKLLSFRETVSPDFRNKKIIVPCLEEDEQEQNMDSIARMNSTTVILDSTNINDEKFVENNGCYLVGMGDYYFHLFRDPKRYEFHTTATKGLGMFMQEKNFATLTPILTFGDSFPGQNNGKNAPENVPVFVKLGNEDWESKSFPTNMTTKSGQEDAFKLHKISETMKYNILYVYSAIPFLVRFVKIIKLKMKEKLTTDFFKLVCQRLEKLIHFLLDCSQHTDLLHAEGNPKQEKQYVFKELRMIEIITDILYYMFQPGMYKFEEIHMQDQFLIRVCSTLSPFTLLISSKAASPPLLSPDQARNSRIPAK